ncbi:MAG: YqjK-like family protein [Rhodocyclaceae bacterium]
MAQRLIEIGVRRGRLIERIASQRALLGQQLEPVRSALHSADRASAGLRAGIGYLRQHPGIVLAAVAVLAILKPRRTWRWAQRGFVAWRAWRAVRAQLAAFGSRG